MVGWMVVLMVDWKVEQLDKRLVGKMVAQLVASTADL